MKIHRIYAVILRYTYTFMHSLNRMTDAFYWPFMDLLIWGLTISYINTISNGSGNVVVTVISGLLLWLVVWRGQYEISVNLLDDLWTKNLINMFVTPLQLSEWIVSVVLLGILKVVFSLGFAAIAAFILYRVALINYGFYLIPFFILLFMTGWWVGFIVAGCILRFGTKVEQFAWSMIYVLAPFSAIYYPVSILPEWAKIIAKFVPTTYVFEEMRSLAKTGNLDGSQLLISLFLNSLYLVLSLLFLQSSFKKVLQKGLVKIY